MKIPYKLRYIISDSTVIGHENRANHKTQMLNQTTTDDNVVTPSKVKDNFKRTSIEDNQKRKKYQIKNNFYLSETSKRKEADSYEILPKGHNRDQHQSEKLNNDQVQTINITNCVANDPQENSSTQFSGIFNFGSIFTFFGTNLNYYKFII